MSKCLVLGANGFIGSHLTDALLRAGHSVRAFDVFRDKKTNLTQGHDNLEIYEGDFFKSEDLSRALNDIDYVFHFISTTNPASSSEDPLVDVETNLKNTVELLKLCVEKKIKRVIFPSSGGAIYGRSAVEALSEDDLAEPISPYAIGKQAIEGYLRYFKATYGLDYLVLRLSNPYGERQNLTGTQGVIPIFLNKLKRDESVTVFGDGSMVRDYIYVTDVANMITEMFYKEHKYDVYNFGSGDAISLSDLIKKMEHTSGKKFKIGHHTIRPTDVHRVVIDVSRIEQEFGLSSTVDLDKGLSMTWQYVNEQ